MWYWLEQIQAILGDKNKPVVVVGTHADEIVRNKQDPNAILQNLVDQLKKNPNLRTCDINCFIAVGMSSGFGLQELKSSLVDIALSHPQIGIFSAKVPTAIVALQQHMQFLVQQNRMENSNTAKYYMEWSEFETLCLSKNILLQ